MWKSVHFSQKTLTWTKFCCQNEHCRQRLLNVGNYSQTLPGLCSSFPPDRLWQQSPDTSCLGGGDSGVCTSRRRDSRLPHRPVHCSSHCCVFVLIITCAVCNTMGRVQSTGPLSFMVEVGAMGGREGGLLLLPKHRSERGAARAGRWVPQQETWHQNASEQQHGGHHKHTLSNHSPFKQLKATTL